MLRSGEAHLKSLRDGRMVLIGAEKVEDVTQHSSLSGGARTVAKLYDVKAKPEHQHFAASGEAGALYSSYFLQPRTPEDLRMRAETHRLLARETAGMWGRSMDHVASFITGMAMRPEIFEQPEAGARIQSWHARLRDEDAYVSYAINNPQGSRDGAGEGNPALRIVAENTAGIVLSGLKMLATAGIYANYLFIGNITPLSPHQTEEALTCILPIATDGLSLWLRKPFAPDAGPLGAECDETDAMVLCKNVFVPWENVFTWKTPALTRRVFFETPGHSLGNHQSNIRFHEKLKFIAGLAHKITECTGSGAIQAVKETLGRLASMEALLGGVIEGQISAPERWGEFLGVNRRMVYAALMWCTENHTAIVDILRELCGGGMFQMPADFSVLQDETLAADFTTYFRTPGTDAESRMRLFRLAWDVIGSEFAGRHQSYEKFYAGGPFAVRLYNHSIGDWPQFTTLVDRKLDQGNEP